MKEIYLSQGTLCSAKFIAWRSDHRNRDVGCLDVIATRFRGCMDGALIPVSQRSQASSPTLSISIQNESLVSVDLIFCDAFFSSGLVMVVSNRHGRCGPVIESWIGYNSCESTARKGDGCIVLIVSAQCTFGNDRLIPLCSMSFYGLYQQNFHEQYLNGFGIVSSLLCKIGPSYGWTDGFPDGVPMKEGLCECCTHEIITERLLGWEARKSGMPKCVSYRCQ